MIIGILPKYTGSESSVVSNTTITLSQTECNVIACILVILMVIMLAYIIGLAITGGINWILINQVYGMI